jgi:hypothetical protein
MKARNTGREPSIGSRPEDDGLLGQLVDSLSPSKSEKRRRFPPENRSDTDFPRFPACADCCRKNELTPKASRRHPDTEGIPEKMN